MIKKIIKYMLPYGIVHYYEKKSIKKNERKEAEPLGPGGIRLVNYDLRHGWILNKFADNLHQCLHKMHLESNIDDKPDPTASVNHHIIYHVPNKRTAGIETLMITHVDTQSKLERLRQQQHIFDMGICMSAETVKLLSNEGISRE